MVKIFSNFDTQLYPTLLLEKQQEFGTDSVLGVRRWYVFFLLEILPVINLMILIIVAIWIVTFFVDTSDILPYSVLLGIQIALTVIVVLRLLPSIAKQYMDYKLDFAIITPIELISYNQSNLFTRSSKTIKTNNIKTVSLDKSGIFKSIFNYGTLIFLSEWDEAGKGELDMFYVSKPEEVKNEVSRIMSLRLDS